MGCDKCGRWFHQWCYGYGWVEEDAFDSKQPFECWTCQAERVKESASEARMSKIEEALVELGELAVIRRRKWTVRPDIACE